MNRSVQRVVLSNLAVAPSIIVQFALASCSFLFCQLPQQASGGGAPVIQGGAASLWTYAGKTGIGTSYEAYKDGEFDPTSPTGTVSKVWFSLAEGIVTETAFGLVHEAQIRDMQFLVTGSNFFDEEKRDTKSMTEYLHTDAAGRPRSLAYRIINTDKQGKYTIEKHVFTHPDRQALFMRVIFKAHENNITPFLLVNPHMKNTGNDDVAYVSSDYLNARSIEHDHYLSVKSSAPFAKVSAGFVGESDGWTDLHNDRKMDWQYDWADGGRGNVALTAQFETLSAGDVKTFDVVVGFGNSHAAAINEANATLGDGYDAVLDNYNGDGAHTGWEDYIDNLSHLPGLIPFSGDNGKQLYASALVLKALEDKTYPGALIASLSVPWGDTESADHFRTGYRAVWVRDFYQVASAFMALGDAESAKVAFDYLDTFQVEANTDGNNGGAAGWFLQKTHVDGTQEWNGVQMDQVAMPIMLGWKLWKAGALSDQEIEDAYWQTLKPAAEFLSNGGFVNFRNNQYQISSPRSQQERWEEQDGYSPSTVAAVIAGLLTAADIAKSLGDPGAADHYERKADQFEQEIENTMFTTNGVYGDDEYFIRITKDDDPNNAGPISGANGKPAFDERRVLDPGFLELVRYGVRAPTDPSILNSLDEIDDMSRPDKERVKYVFSANGNTYPGYRRYADGDGYGERTSNGARQGDHPDNRGRVWPILTGERGHYELARLKATVGTLGQPDIQALRNSYVKAMEHFGNDGLMMPEQVWDDVGNNNTYGYKAGEGTNSATPLAWSHAEYVKLLRSLKDQQVWDFYPIVSARYQQP